MAIVEHGEYLHSEPHIGDILHKLVCLGKASPCQQLLTVGTCRFHCITSIMRRVGKNSVGAGSSGAGITSNAVRSDEGETGVANICTTFQGTEKGELYV